MAEVKRGVYWQAFGSPHTPGPKKSFEFPSAAQKDSKEKLDVFLKQFARNPRALDRIRDIQVELRNLTEGQWAHAREATPMQWDIDVDGFVITLRMWKA